MLNLVHFTYLLPDHRIALRPVEPYDQAKMMVIQSDNNLHDDFFYSIKNYLNEGDTLVFNNSKVIKARLLGVLCQTGAKVELLLSRPVLNTNNEWLATGRPIKRIKAGSLIDCGGLNIFVKERISDRELHIVLDLPPGLDSLATLDKFGCMPIPPYIRDGLSDIKDDTDYQPPFAALPGSIAASTASLHFTPLLLDDLKNSGINIRTVTLHLGMASFQPVFGEPMPEFMVWSPDILNDIKNLQKQGRIIAVGTSVVRALESMHKFSNEEPGLLETDLFIRAGYKFKIVQGIITNFHQPNTTHLHLVEAAIGRELLNTCYNHALDNNYRFLSYGDGMFIQNVVKDYD